METTIVCWGSIRIMQKNGNYNSSLRIAQAVCTVACYPTVEGGHLESNRDAQSCLGCKFRE